MADAATQQLVEQIVQERVQASAMFTAYDITLEARRRGGNVRHNDVRDLVHECYEQGRMGAAYNRSTVDVGAPTRPFLYHHFSTDPRSYQPPTGGASSQPPPAGKPGLIGRIVNKLLGGGSPKPAGPSGQAGGTGKSAGPSRWSDPATRSDPATQRPPSPAAGLDTSPYLPIGRDEIKSEMRGTNFWSSVWFGRRDLIPPVDDKRTLLIDRAMVSQGLLSPEQLAEIHKVGAEMDLVRPDVVALRHQSAQAGQAAVEEDREKRKLLKEQKKREAAEKRRLRAEQIAARRANDIAFLGRGVSGRLGERESDKGKLAACGLPVLSTPAELAAALSLTIPQLRWLAFHADVASRTHYVQFTVPKKSGGVRTLSAPHRRLAAVQTWILRNILEKLPTEPAAQGFIAGRSILTNAKRHVGRQVVVNMDLENFFPSITFPRVRSVFARLGYSPSVSTILALLCTESPRRTVEFNGQKLFVATGPRGLPQGACTSPALSNQAARRLDKRLQGLAAKLGLAYTRYADDLTLSGDEGLHPRVGYCLARLRHIAQDEGFTVNEKKTRVLRRNAAQKVTGLVVNDKPGVARAEIRRIRAILHQARKTGLSAQNRANHPNFSAWLSGKIAYISMSRPDVGQKLKQELATLES